MNCQFYVVLGDVNYISRDSARVCITIRDNELENYDEIKRKLFNTYNEKIKEGFIVNNEIIFLIFDERYRNIALKIMSQVGLNGRVLALNGGNVNANKNENVTNNVVQSSNNESANNSQNDAKVEEHKYTYRPDTQIFYKEDFSSGDGGTPRTYGGVSNSKGSKVNSKVLSLKPVKSGRAAFISFPVIVFIFSTLLLIASFVLLFIMD